MLAPLDVRTHCRALGYTGSALRPSAGRAPPSPRRQVCRNAPSFPVSVDDFGERRSITAVQGPEAFRAATRSGPCAPKLGAFLHTEAGHRLGPSLPTGPDLPSRPHWTPLDLTGRPKPSTRPAVGQDARLRPGRDMPAGVRHPHTPRDRFSVACPWSSPSPRRHPAPGGRVGGVPHRPHRPPRGGTRLQGCAGGAWPGGGVAPGPADPW